jgi:enoyl-CoA hydratase/carnithine racemase
MEPFAGGRIGLVPGRVAELRLTAPDRRNAISRAMWDVLPPLMARIAADHSRALILAADGPVFSAGADIGEFAEVYATPDKAQDYNALVRAGQAAITALPCPVIAAVGGAAVGGGCGLCLSADLILAAPGARFGITPARLGLAYSWEDTARLVARVGPGTAKEMLFTGRLLDADEALARGLIDRIVPDPEAEARMLAAGIAALSPVSVGAAKRTVNALTAPGWPDRAGAEAEIAAAFDSADFAEGRAAFLARRSPDYS